jgi:MFS family permease
MLDGLRYLRSRPDLVAMLLLTGGLCVFGWPALTLFPAYTKLVLGMAEKEYTTLVSCLGAGALTAALVNATFGTSRRSGRLLLIGAATAAIGLFALANVNTLVEAGAGGVLLGFGLILFLSTGQSRMQLSVPDAVRGRAMAFWAMTLSASAPIGHIAAGAAAQVWPIPDVVMVLGCGACAVTVGVALGLRSNEGTTRLRDVE